MKLTFLTETRVMMTTWDKKIAFKTYFAGNQLEDVGVTEDLVDSNLVTISHNKNSFSINKNLIKIE